MQVPGLKGTVHGREIPWGFGIKYDWVPIPVLPFLQNASSLSQGLVSELTKWGQIPADGRLRDAWEQFHETPGVGLALRWGPISWVFSIHDRAAPEGLWSYGRLGRKCECTAGEMARPNGSPGPLECGPCLAFTQSQTWSQTCHLWSVPELSLRGGSSRSQRDLDSGLGIRGTRTAVATFLLWKSGPVHEAGNSLV